MLKTLIGHSEKVFESRPGLRLRRGEQLACHSSWRIGGPADFFIEPHSLAELRAALDFADKQGLPHLIIGQGTNLLFADAGYRGLIIKLGRSFAGCRFEAEEVVVDAGILVCRLARMACQRGLAGLEHAVGIPGTLGGLIVMNGGSLRHSISENLLWVEVLDGRGDVGRISNSECGFAYRRSRFQVESSVILRARLCLRPGRTAEIRRDMLKVLRERRRKFPRKLPNCGSVFKSTPELFETLGPPGRIIEDVGCKGLRSGNAEVSRLHANFIVNRGGATASDVLGLIARVRGAAHARAGVWLDAEVGYVCESGQILPADSPACRESNGSQR
ncbi:MAG: UDP-N-acetylmuramate dehydrogenase [Planctomycetes bacterium]|nr:UDP-N-acetylmuramate dehydrogenase [Planctomycetota bacterium]